MLVSFYGAMIPSILNVISLQGFLILNVIVGGQTLAAVSDRLNDTLGIVIISVISLVVTFLGYRALHLCVSKDVHASLLAHVFTDTKSFHGFQTWSPIWLC